MADTPKRCSSSCCNPRNESGRWGRTRQENRAEDIWRYEFHGERIQARRQRRRGLKRRVKYQCPGCGYHFGYYEAIVGVYNGWGTYLSREWEFRKHECPNCKKS